MGTLHPIKKNISIIIAEDLYLIDELDDYTVDLIMKSTNDLIQYRLCKEILSLRLKLNGHLDIPEDPQYA